MKILVYSDVHGNKYALDKLQESQDYKSADLRIFLGDAVAMCPYPNQCLEKIWENGDIFLIGNHDSYFAYGLPEEEFAYFNDDKKAHQTYMREKTKQELKEKLKSMPKDYYLNCYDKTLYFTHFGWESDRLVKDDPDYYGIPTPDTADVFKEINADYIIFGHNHNPAEFEQDGKKFICVGSLGMKYPGNYLIIDLNENEINIDKKTIYFDIEKLTKDMLSQNYPYAKEYLQLFSQE